jgi:hypothetical protein
MPATSLSRSPPQIMKTNCVSLSRVIHLLIRIQFDLKVRQRSINRNTEIISRTPNSTQSATLPYGKQTYVHQRRTWTETVVAKSFRYDRTTCKKNFVVYSSIEYGQIPACNQTTPVYVRSP